MKKILIILTMFLSCAFPKIKAQGFSIHALNAPTINKKNYNAPKCTVEENILIIENVKLGTKIDIYSVIGTKVTSFSYKGSNIPLDLNKGIYIVRIDKYSQKIIL